MSPKSEDQFEAIRQKSMTNIKETAMELFAHNGYHSTSISKIAKEAGISKGLMYNYFDSKKALLQEILLDTIEVTEAAVMEVMRPEDPPYEQLQKIMDALFESIQSDIHHWKLLTALAAQKDVMTDVQEIALEKQKEFMETGLKIFSQLDVADPEMEVMVFGALLDGIFLHYLNFPGDYPLEAVKQYILKKYEPK
ncbi:MAG: TetR/AcrR family transcriptional regulator [Bacteroidetes bacterium]|nr:MAG: TetR/AcrR family transcriptional regulator [Bacteroidota bacterium]